MFGTRSAPSGPAAGTVTWEYRVVGLSRLDHKTNNKIGDDLTSYGAEGWEAVALIPGHHVGDGAAVLMKRPSGMTG